MTASALNGLIGGSLIGLSAVLLMGMLGRIAGISGMLSGLFAGPQRERLGRMLFLTGLIAAPAALSLLGLPIAFDPRRSPILVIVLAGALVGFGTRLSNGCTSGHGVCGLARLSPRSLAAVATFLASAMLTVYVVRHILNGGAT